MFFQERRLKGRRFCFILKILLKMPKIWYIIIIGTE